MEELATADLQLAEACLKGDRAALARLDEWLTHEAESTARQLKRSASFADELGQVLRQKLLAPPEPKLRDYRGRGSLRKWLKAAALRTGLNLVSAEERAAGQGDDAALEAIEDAAPSPELALLKARHRVEFKAALREAFQSLQPKDRNLLRLYFLESVSSAQLAVTFNTHRVTVTRWIAQAREQVLDATRASLQRRLKLDASELESLRALVHSQLSVSLGDYL
jgi:RNA polymerase sigma-70 factor (ECF subfamily)